MIVRYGTVRRGPIRYEIGIGPQRVLLAVTTLWWRSVGHTHTAYVMETLIDELAHASGQDPLAYRRTLLARHPRHLGALNLAADRAGWGRPLPAGRFRGLAVHHSFDSYIAQVAEVSVQDGHIRVHRVAPPVAATAPEDDPKVYTARSGRRVAKAPRMEAMWSTTAARCGT